MATNKKNPFVSVPTFYERFGYGAPIEDKIYGEMNDEDEGIHPARNPEEEDSLDKDLTDEYEKERQEYIRRQKESMQGYNPYVKQAEMGVDLSRLPSVPADGATRKEVLALQKDLNRFGYGLAEDGIIGPKTRAALEDHTNKVKSQGKTDVDEAKARRHEPGTQWNDALSFTQEEPTQEEPTQEEPTQEEPKATEQDMVKMYGALVPSFFTRMLDMSKPTQYLTADERMRNAARLARRVAPFADSGMAKNIYADAMNRMKTEQGRADMGEQNVLQRRTTAENMWGHYSPAITQALTNSSVFMQRAYQSAEEASKLRQFRDIAISEAREAENILRDQYEQKKVNFYLAGKPVSFDEFKQLVEGNKVALMKSPYVETNNQIAALASQYRAIIAKRAEADKYGSEAAKNERLSMQQQEVADANKNFAQESQSFFGFPTMKLPDVKMPVNPRPEIKGTRATLDGTSDGQNGGVGGVTGGNTPVNMSRTVGAAGAAGKTGTTAGKTVNTGTMAGTAGKAGTTAGNNSEFSDVEKYLEDGRNQYLKFEKNNSLSGSKFDAPTLAKHAEISYGKQYAEASNSIFEKGLQKDLSKFVFNDFRHRPGAINDMFKSKVDQRYVAYNSNSIKNLMNQYGVSDNVATLYNNILQGLHTRKLSREDAQIKLKELSTSLRNAKMLPDKYKIEVYPDGSDIAIIPNGTVIWKDEDGSYSLEDMPEEME